MGEQPKNLLPGLSLLAFVGLLIWYTSWNSQIRRPVPGLPSAPVVPQLPGLIADLRSAKSNCEGLGRQLKTMARERRLTRRDLDHGAQLYIAAKADYDGCIEFLRSGLVRRFQDDDPVRIKRRMDEANKKMMAFTSWADKKINPNVVGAAGPLGEALDHLLDWLKRVNQENEEAVMQLRADLETCRLTDWSDLK